MTFRLIIPFIYRAAPFLLAGALFTALWNPVIEPWFEELGITTKEDEVKVKEDAGVQVKVITSAEYMEKVEEDKSFLLYVGRNSCPDCIAFEENILSELNMTATMYKLDTQQYKDDIDSKKEQAQEIYDEFKKEIGYEWIPYIAVYLNGKWDNAFNFEFPDELRTLEQEKQDEYWRDVKDRFVVWLKESTEAVDETDSACGIDQRCE